MVLELGVKYNKRIHVCHISLAQEVELVRKEKRNNQQITAGVCLHHLFLTDTDRKKLGSFALMKPPLGDKQNQQAVWQGLLDGTIDLVETDHAPHTIAEKKADLPAFGIPGLETALGLLLTAVHEKKLTLGRVKKFLYENPKKIFNIPNQENTYIEFDPEKPYIFDAKNSQSKCKWSPFDGWQLYGKVETVVIEGRKVLEKGRFV
jgi:carbamoyl-phosphate synthase/aspartate carbamoyltransferase/dihydroorotase